MDSSRAKLPQYRISEIFGFITLGLITSNTHDSVINAGIMRMKGCNCKTAFEKNNTAKTLRQIERERKGKRTASWCVVGVDRLSAIFKTDLRIIYIFFIMQTNILFTGDIIYW